MSSENDSSDSSIAARPRKKKDNQSSILMYTTKNKDGETSRKRPKSNVRRSSRSTMFKCSLQEPNASSLADFFPDKRKKKKAASSESESDVSEPKRKRTRSRKKKVSSESSSEEKAYSKRPRAAKKQSVIEEDTDSSDDSDKIPVKRKGKEDSPPATPVKNNKSPAVSHKSRRHVVHVEVPVSSSEEHDSSEEDEELKVGRIIASKTETLSKWNEICSKLNTSEIEEGSRWFQPPRSDETYEERFLIKWDDLSYLHVSWETERDLLDQIERAKTLIKTFFKKATNGFYFDVEDRGDGEFFDPALLQIERILEVTDGGKIIMDKGDPEYESGTGRQFLVKWAGSDYVEAKFEFERDLILNEVEFEEHVDAFYRRNKKPSYNEMKKLYSASDASTRRLYKIFGEKLSMKEGERESKIKEFQEGLMKEVFRNGGQLRDYQVEGISWLLSNYLNVRNSILADEMGLGKTIQTVVYINSVAKTLHKRGPFLVVAPLSTVAHWYREFTSWTDLNTIIYHGSAKNREHIREYEFAFEKDRPRCLGVNQSFLKKCHKQKAPKWEKTWMIDVVITTPELLVAEDYAELSYVSWEILIVDEAHRMKNNTSKFASNLREGRFRFERSLLLTGTPIQNNMNELWALLNFLDPETFGSVDEFLKSYGTITEKEQMDALHESIRPYILRRLKEDVEKSVPPKEETVVEVELTILQKQYYRALYEKNVQFLHRNHRKALDGPSINNLAMQLRKCCNHPYLLRGVELEVRSQENKSGGVGDEGDFLVKASGKLVFLDKLLPWLRDDGHRVLIFSQFKIMLDILEDYLNLRNFKYERIDGSITGHKRQNAIDRFQAKGDPSKLPFVMMLSTRAGGVGINLTAADTVVIFDSDWNPQNDLQAQARCHRIGQTKDVKVYRLLTRKTYELQMFHMSSLKMGLDQAVLQGLENGNDNTMTKEEVEKLLRHGAYDIFNEEKTGTANAESEEFMAQDINSILERRTKVVVHGGKEEKQGGSTFSKATFKAGTGDGVEADNVDIDDPNFWSKVVGEAKPEHNPNIQTNKTRKRKVNYTDFFDPSQRKIYSSDSAVDDDSEGGNSDDDFLLPTDYETEPTKWGAKKNGPLPAAIPQTEQNGTVTPGKPVQNGTVPLPPKATCWEKSHVESVVSHIQKYGYHDEMSVQVNQTVFITKSLPYPLQEIQRMCWSVVLMCLYETAVAEAREVRKEAKPAEKKDADPKVIDMTTSPATTSPATTSPTTTSPATQEDPAKKSEALKLIREGKFSQLLAYHRSWIDQAIADANAYANSSKPRPAKIVDSQILSQGAHHEPNQPLPLTEAFNKNLWPQLRSRGWVDEQIPGVNGNPPSIRYKYNTTSYTQIRIILQIVPVIHPELSGVIDTILKSVNTGNVRATESNDKLDSNTMTMSSLKQFLYNFAPLQFISDRNRNDKIALPPKMLKICFYMKNARMLISPLTSLTKEGLYIQIDQLSKAIVKSKELILPPAPWTRTHDAIFIRAIVEHGWIESSYKEVNNDVDSVYKSISDLVKKNEEVNKKATGVKIFSEEEKIKFREVAGRALQFFVAYDDDFIKSTKGFNRDRVFKTYGMAWDDSSYIIDESLLEKSLVESQKHLNSLRIEKRLEKPMNKIEMVKRAKSILSSDQKARVDAASDVNDIDNYGYPLLDDTDPCNVLLSEMLRGLLKLSFVKPDDVYTWKKLIRLARSEAQYLIDSTLTDGDDDMRRIERCIHAVDLRYRPQCSSTPLKNVFKVILGQKPNIPKGSLEQMFPDFKVPTGTSIANSPAKDKNEDKVAKKGGSKRENAAGENALNRALAAVNQSKLDTSVQSGTTDKTTLPLSYLEALLLTVMLSSGIPCTEDEKVTSTDSDKISGDVGQEFRISWKTLAGVLEVAAKRWYSRSSERRPANEAGAENDLTKKRKTVDEASELTKNPTNFARRSVMLLEALRVRMGPVEISQGGSLKKLRQSYKSELSLGPRVLVWYKKELLKLSTSLEIVNKKTNLPYNSTAHDLSSRTEFHPAAFLDKKSCRLIFGQIAQLSRLRSLFVKYGSKGISDQVPKAVKNCRSNGDLWSDRPSWWNESHPNTDDFDLLLGLLNLGFSNFDHLNTKNDSFKKRKEECSVPCTFNSASIQQRVNGLTRELSALDDTAEMIRKLNERHNTAKKSKQASTSVATTEESAKKSHSASSIQSPIDAFFRSSNKKESSAIESSNNSSEKPAATNNKDGSKAQVAKTDSSPKKVTSIKNGVHPSSDLNKKAASMASKTGSPNPCSDNSKLTNASPNERPASPKKDQVKKLQPQSKPISDPSSGNPKTPEIQSEKPSGVIDLSDT